MPTIFAQQEGLAWINIVWLSLAVFLMAYPVMRRILRLLRRK